MVYADTADETNLATLISGAWSTTNFTPKPTIFFSNDRRLTSVTTPGEKIIIHPVLIDSHVGGDISGSYDHNELEFPVECKVTKSENRLRQMTREFRRCINASATSGSQGTTTWDVLEIKSSAGNFPSTTKRIPTGYYRMYRLKLVQYSKERDS